MDQEFIQEGKAKILKNESVFYNPHMQFNRDLSSLVVGATKSIIPSLTVCDGMSASGIRGMRYVLENDNVQKVSFVDSEETACEFIRQNVKLNDLEEKSTVICDDVNHQLNRGGIRYNFVELDPFGSPVPYIRTALINLRPSKLGVLSVTATDTAVLCGANHKACMINYCARPMHNYLCHEVGLRILIGHIARIAAPLHLGIVPLFSLSKRHYMKTIMLVKKSSESAFESISQMGYISFCPKCLEIKASKKPNLPSVCEKCSIPIEWAGPLWLGKIYDDLILEQMTKLNEERDYSNKKQISLLLEIMKSESNMPILYYDLHAIADHFNMPCHSFEETISRLKAKGFSVSRTHFNQTAIKTDALISDVLNALK